MAITLADIGLGASTAGSILSILGAYKKSKGDKDAFNYQAQVDRENAQVAEWEAQDAILQGQKAEVKRDLKTGDLIGKQEAGFAARGVAINEGSPLRVLNDTAFMGEQDALTIRNNTAREAWALRNQATFKAAEAGLVQKRANDENPFMNAAGTALTTGGTVADKWYQYAKTVS